MSALPSFALDSLLDSPVPHLSHNPSATVAVVNMSFPHPAGWVYLPITGFGYLVPRATEEPYNPHHVLGCVFDSDAMPGLDDLPIRPTLVGAAAPPPNQAFTKMTVMLGGHHWAKGGASVPSEEEIGQHAIRTLRGHFGWSPMVIPTHQLVHLQRDCIPQYLVGHPQRMRALHRSIADGPWRGRLSLIGASYGGVSVNDCVRSGWEAARRIARGAPTTGLEWLPRDGEEIAEGTAGVVGPVANLADPTA